MSGGHLWRFCGRDFTDRDIERIRGLISARPEEDRAGLSRAVCDEFRWMKPDAGRKDVACRVAMLRMEKAGLIKLPPPRHAYRNGRNRPSITAATDTQPLITNPAGELGSLVFEIVDQRGPSRLWNEFVERYHYLGYSRCSPSRPRHLACLEER